ncbi:MAG TPA: macro domain-containing protein [Kofleriaceae bacterium]|nr:macro domain-containing protein [Kofleriaceae bacterium]
MDATVVEGDLLDQRTEAIVNAWNRNIIPWWLLLPQGVSGAIKKRAGLQPFREIGRAGAIALGDAVPTSAGRLPYKAIIHVAGINMLWRASRFSVSASTRNAVAVAERLGLDSLAFPLIGAGSGGLNAADVEGIMLDALRAIDTDVRVVVVRYRAR